jgi:hypothetical protein
MLATATLTESFLSGIDRAIRWAAPVNAVVEMMMTRLGSPVSARAGCNPPGTTVCARYCDYDSQCCTGGLYRARIAEYATNCAGSRSYCVEACPSSCGACPL